MAKDSSIKGTIGKYYKDMFPIHAKQKEGQGETSDGSDSKYQLSKQISAKNGKVESLLSDKQGPELVPQFSNETAYFGHKKKIMKKTESCPRNRRRSRQDRNQSKPKKQNTLNDFGPGTTIIVIQRNEEQDGSYSTKQLQDFDGLEEEIMKLKRNNFSAGGKQQMYRSEHRSRKKPSIYNPSTPNPIEHKGKPPLNSMSQDPFHGSHIPKIGDRKSPIKRKVFGKTVKVSSKNVSQKSSRLNSVDSE